MKKIFTITAALATTAVMVSSVFAETSADMTAAYDATSGKVILTNAPTQSTTTYIVFAPSTLGEDGLETGTVAKGSIKQINQEENSVAEIYVGTLAAGKYQVRLGGEGSVYNALFTVGSPSPSPSPSTDPSPSPSTDPSPSPSADPEPSPSADPEPSPSADPEPTVKAAAVAVGDVFEGDKLADGTDRAVAAKVVLDNIKNTISKITWKIKVTPVDGKTCDKPYKTFEKDLPANVDGSAANPATLKVGLVVTYDSSEIADVTIKGIDY